ncbi:hypothetical protein ACLOJK_007509 [Asimina triloba]
MADPVVSVLLEKLVTFLIDGGSQLLEFEDQLEIKEEFQYMQNYVKDANRMRRRDRSETLRQIMNDVRELIYDAEEIIADCQLLCQKKNKQGWASPCLSPTLLKSGCVLGRKLREVNKRIKQMKQNMISYLATVPVHGKKEECENIPLTYPVLISDDSIVGLEEESRRIVNSLLVKENYLIVGIVVLANDSTVGLEGIFLKKMIKKVGVADGSLQGKGVDDLLEMLKYQLDDKYLIVLDDVWEVGQWLHILDSALPKGKGGCVMVTIRNQGVARSMGATNEYIYGAEFCRRKIAGCCSAKSFARNGGISPNTELEKCGKEIVAECRGLPLTIRVVGGMMLGKGDSRLELSYEELPTNVKPYLLCFAVYPEDYETLSIRIIRMWIAEGLVRHQRWEKNA